MECYGYLKSNYDGTHLRGPAAARHFTYRAANAIKCVFGKKTAHFRFQRNRNYSSRNYDNSKRGRNNPQFGHNNCEQAQHQMRQQYGSDRGSGQTVQSSF